MSGHSKWHSIKHKKGIADSKRGKIFTQHAKLIALAAQQGGGDPEMNPSLRAAIDRAKMDNVPNANIERAVKRGTGELKDGTTISEVMYEGYAPGGAAVYVQAVTDNKNRTVSNVRAIFTKHGGNLGEAGCVAWMFSKKGILVVSLSGKNLEEVEMAVIESGAEDMEVLGDALEVRTSYEDFMTVKKALEAAGLSIERAELSFVPKDSINIEDESTARKILKLMEALDEDEDVTNVASNFDIDEGILAKLSVE